MAYKHYVGDKFFGLSTDTKPLPTTLLSGATLYEIDVSDYTVTQYALYDGDWREQIVRKIDDSGSANDVLWSAAKIITELADKVDKVVGKGLSDENYTLAEKNKLAGLENSSHLQGTDQTLDFGGVNQVGAADLRNHLDNHPETNPGGNDKTVQFNNGGNFEGSDDHTYNNTSKVRQLIGFDRIKEHPTAVIPSAAHNEAVRGVKTETVGSDEVVTHYLKRGDGVEVIVSSYIHTP